MRVIVHDHVVIITNIHDFSILKTQAYICFLILKQCLLRGSMAQDLNKCVGINSVPFQIPDIMFLSKTDLNTNCAISAVTFTNYQLPHLVQFLELSSLLPLSDKHIQLSHPKLIPTVDPMLLHWAGRDIQSLFAESLSVNFDWIMFSD